jgi:hypothetical protein
MTHRKGAIWTERLLLGLILLSLAATLNLMLAIHRQAPADKQASTEAVAAPSLAGPRERAPAPPPEPAAPDAPIVTEQSAPPPQPPVEDPTKKAIASLATSRESETKAAADADRRASALEKGYRSAVAESDRWKRREMLVRQQIAGITAEAEKLEREVDELDAERDVLERELDATKAALAKASTRAGFAVLPYKGPNGTWRRPIVIECTGGGAKLQPRGPSFTGIELSPRIHPRSSDFVKAIARELFHIRSADTPDGTPAVPYIVFLVRPDGIGAYYLARTSLEPLGIAFGYELIEQKLAVNIPDYDDLTTWDGTMPLDMPLEPAPGSLSSPRRLARGAPDHNPSASELAGSPRGDQNAMIGSLAQSGARAGQRGGGGAAESAGPEDFVWPGRGRGTSRDGERAGQAATGNSAQQTGERGAGGNGFDGGLGNLNPSGGRELALAKELGSSRGSGGTDEAGPGVGNDAIGGRIAATGAGGQGSGSRTVGSAGTTPNAVNVEDVGGSGDRTEVGAGVGARVAPTAGTGARTGASSKGDPADLPFAGGGPGTGGAGGGSRALGGRTGGTVDGFPLPNLEPAVDPADGSPASAPGGLPSSGARVGGRQQTGQTPIFSQGGDEAGSLGPEQSNAGAAKAASGDRTGGRGQAQGFDWNLADQDRSPSGDQSGTYTQEDVDRAKALAGKFSQEDVDRAKAIAENLSPEDIERAKAIAGNLSQEDVDRAKALSGLSSLVSPRLAAKFLEASGASSAASGAPSNSDSRNSASSSQSGGMPLGGTTQSSSSSSTSSSASFGQVGLPIPSPSSDDSKELTMPPRKKDAAPEHAIDARFEIVVVCRKDEVLLHPGAYRLTGDVLRGQGEGTDSMLVREIRAMVRNRAIVDPLIHQKPSIRFLVESQGAETFSVARRQLLFSLPDWPISLQVAGSHDADVFSRNRW